MAGARDRRLNFELPAHAHSTRDAVRCTYEYADFVRSFVDVVQMPGGDLSGGHDHVVSH